MRGRFLSARVAVWGKQPRGVIGLCAVLLFAAGSLHAADSAPAAGSSAPAAPAANTPAPVPDALILRHLNVVAAWYRQLSSLDPAAGHASDLIFFNNFRGLSSRVVQFAFQAADSEAALLVPASADNGPAAGSTSAEAVRLHQAKAGVDEQIESVQGQIRQLVVSVRSAAPADAPGIALQIGRAQAEVDFLTAQTDALANMTSFLDQNIGGSTGIFGRIEALKQSVPGAFAAAAAESKIETAGTEAADSGLIGKTSVLMTRMRALHDIDHALKSAQDLSGSIDQQTAPLRAALHAAVSQVHESGSAAGTSSLEALSGQRSTIEQQTAAFKLLIAAAAPLEQERVLLGQSIDSLGQWRSSIHQQYAQSLRAVLLQILVVAAALGLLTLGSEAWRRATFRYVHDVRRRRQLLVIRRVVSTALMLLVIVLGFVREFSSLATFGGFLTAGIAVAFQTVLLSVAAYFFLIGRYGVRVGDRVTISGVTGDVIEIGLVRIYMLELAGTGVDVYPTGRIVVFSNSVLFQSTPFFKQVPGTSYSWHEVSLTFTAGADRSEMERKVLDTVHRLYAGYRDRLAQQHSTVERFLETSLPMPEPQALARLIDAGLEYVVRYPVEIHNAPNIDDQVSREITALVASDEEFRKALVGSPIIRSAIKT